MGPVPAVDVMVIDDAANPADNDAAVPAAHRGGGSDDVCRNCCCCCCKDVGGCFGGGPLKVTAGASLKQEISDSCESLCKTVKFTMKKVGLGVCVCVCALFHANARCRQRTLVDERGYFKCAKCEAGSDYNR